METTSARFDFPRRDRPPRRIYMIACTQRTGSTLLGHALWRRGVLGAPMSYFNPWLMEQYRKAYGLETDRDFADLIQSRRTSPNGVFGFKILSTHWRGLRDAAPHLASRLVTSHIVLLRRRNVVAQAVSLYKAETSRQYFTDHSGVNAEPPYDFAQIRARVARINAQTRRWAGLLSDLGVTPIEAWYEDLGAQLDEIADALCVKLGVDPSARAPTPREIPELARQSNRDSLDLEERFRSEWAINQHRTGRAALQETAA